MSYPEWILGPEDSSDKTRFGELPLFREGLYRTASDCYAWMVPNGSWGETNIGLIDCNGQSVLIDTCWDLKFTKALTKSCGELLKNSPVEYIINTHADGDHCWGNQLFADKPIIATDACLKGMHHYSPGSLKTLTHAGRVLSRLPLGSVRLFGHYMANMFAPYDFSDVAITPPNETFSGEKTLNVNGLDIVIKEVGPGHTDGDAMVWIPDRAVAYTGDIIFNNATPVMWAGPVANITNALKRLLDMSPRVIIPGHGNFATPEDVQNLLDYWEFLQDQLHARANIGMSSYEAACSVVSDRIFKESVFSRWDSPERIVTNARNIYREWGIQEPSLPGTLQSLNLFRQQAMLAFQLADASPYVMRHLSKEIQ